MKKIIVLSFFIASGISAYAQHADAVSDKGYLEATHSVFSDDGVLFTNKKGYLLTLVKYPQNKSSNSYTIPEGVYCIAKGAFQGNKTIRTIRIPSSVRFIGDNAFADCDQLESIEIYTSASAVRAVENDEPHSQAREVGRYNIQGVKIEEGEDGQVQIILYSDGTSKKVIE